MEKTSEITQAAVEDSKESTIKEAMRMIEQMDPFQRKLFLMSGENIISLSEIYKERGKAS